MALDVTKVAAAFDKIAAKKRKEIYSQLMKDTEVVSPLLNALNVVSGIQADQVYYGSNAKMTEILQGWVDDKVKKGTFSLIPNEIRQRRHMIYTGIKPDKVVGTIEGDRFDETKDITDQMLVDMLIEMITGQVREDRIYKQLYRGKYVAPTNNQVNPAENAVDGFNEIIEAGLEQSDADKKINGINIGGGLDEDLIYEQLTEDFIMAIDEKFRYRPMDAYLSPDMYHRYLIGRESTIGLRVNTADTNPVFIPNTRIRLNAEPSMVGSKRIFATPNWNLVRIVDKKTDAASGLKAKDYAVDEVTIYGDYHEAFGFNYNMMVWTNKLSNNGSGGGDENESFVS